MASSAPLQLPIGQKAAIGFAALACLSSLAAFSGWVLDSPILRGFGVEGRPIWPLSILGYLGLSLGLLAAMRGELRLARIFWAIPLLISGLALAQNALRIDIGIDLLLFRDSVSRYDTVTPGRPAASVTTILVL
ncbi:MAG: hypothetical protein EOP59_04485, partial [Sphingomonadales bacterium]